MQEHVLIVAAASDKPSREEGANFIRKFFLDKTEAFYCGKSYSKIMRGSKYSYRKNLKKQLIITAKLDFLVKEGLVQFTKGYSMITLLLQSKGPSELKKPGSNNSSTRLSFSLELTTKILFALLGAA